MKSELCLGWCRRVSKDYEVYKVNQVYQEKMEPWDPRCP